MDSSSKIYVAGHRGLVGSAVMRRLAAAGYSNAITRTREELDLSDSGKVREFFEKEKPEYVFLSAAKVGGIAANNTYPADFIYQNLMIEANIIHSAYLSGVKKLLFLGSSCIYPKLCPQPIREEYLLTGPLEPTNSPYALAKIAGLEMCRSYQRQYGCDFISAMPTNLYGINDNFDLQTSHVLPALIRKFHEGKVEGKKEVVLWGTGSPMREFLYVDDLAEALLFLMHSYSGESHINVGTGEDVTIRDLADTVKTVTGYTGTIVWDPSVPDGTPRKLLNVEKIHALGWHHRTDLPDGIRRVYDWYRGNPPCS